MTKIVVTCEDFDAKLEGTEPRALPPFPELLLDPSAIWPQAAHAVMPPLTTRYVLISLASGAARGLIGYVLASAAFRSAIWGAVLVSPAIGVVFGLSFRWIHGLSATGRVFVASTLFGLALGFSDRLLAREFSSGA